MITKRKLDKTGTEVSMLGFGCMRFPVEGEGDANVIFEEAEKMVDVAFKSGVNYFDTAFGYHSGNSEPIMGKILKKYPREDFFLATKFPLWNAEEEADVLKIFEQQLERLQTDYIDFYLIHAVNQGLIEKIKNFDVIGKLKKLKADDKIRNIGFSFHDELSVFKEVIDIHDWDFCMIQLNYMDTDTQQGIEGYHIATEKGIPVMIMEPVKGGNLAKFNDEVTEIFNEVDPNATPASFALRWAGSLPNVKSVLSGMSNMEQVMDNINTFTDFKPLDGRETEMISKVQCKLKSYYAVSCTACQYCMPCPAKVDIPGMFNTYNHYSAYKNEWHFNWVIGEARKNSRSPEFCVNCGVCLAKCPQKIDIPAKLSEIIEFEKKLKSDNE